MTADQTHHYTVAGIVEFPNELRELVVFPPQALPGADPHRREVWLVDTPRAVDWAQLRALNSRA